MNLSSPDSRLVDFATTKCWNCDAKLLTKCNSSWFILVRVGTEFARFHFGRQPKAGLRFMHLRVRFAVLDHMIWTAYLDESGTHNSPIMLMGGYLANAEQWDAFNSAWEALLKSEGIQSVHGKDLEHSAKQFKGWSRQRRDAFRVKAAQVMALHLQLGVTAIIRQNDCDSLYKAQANPRRLRQDTKYGVLFRGCLLFVESAVTLLQLPTKDLTLDFVLETGVKNAADAPRLFELAKQEHLPQWAHLLGTLTFGDKSSCGLQAADLLVYYASRVERKDHADKPTDIEKSPYVLPPGETGRPGFREYRMPITQRSLKGLAADFLVPPEKWVNMQSK
jgi:uncharacterized protein DUF3800